jgi:hypothetical protein
MYCLLSGCRPSERNDREAWDSSEFGRVGRRDGHSMTHGGRCDPHVVRTDHFSTSLQSSPYLGVSPGDGGGDRQWLDRGDQVLYEGLASGSNSVIRGTVNAVQQLTGRDHADCPIFLAECTFER